MERIEKDEIPAEGDAEYQKLVEQITQQVIENLKAEYDLVPKSESSSEVQKHEPPKLNTGTAQESESKQQSVDDRAKAVAPPTANQPSGEEE